MTGGKGETGSVPVEVRAVEHRDRAVWLRLRQALWREERLGEHGEEIDRFFSGDFPRQPWQVLLARTPQGRAVGLAELSIRPYAEGCRSRRVAYLEGWYVAPEARRKGVGRALLAAAEAWGREQGCSELASDTEPENETSAAAHAALGFEETGVIRCFRKEL